MQRYAAFLRGVSPTNCKMPELAAAFTAAGLRDVKTLLSSGNVVFSAPRASDATLERKCEAAMENALGKRFVAFVRGIDELAALLERDPFQRHKVAANAKRVVTFLHDVPKAPPPLPVEKQEARILALDGREVLTAYVPQPGQPVFMALIERTFGKDTTTRTWDTVVKAGQAA